jgi:hypothetical protein
MRKLLILLLLVSCQKEDIQPTEPQLDCNCDKVVDVDSFTVSGVVTGSYITINECTDIQRTEYFTGIENRPNVGDCK